MARWERWYAHQPQHKLPVYAHHDVPGTTVCWKCGPLVSLCNTLEPHYGSFSTVCLVPIQMSDASSCFSCVTTSFWRFFKHFEPILNQFWTNFQFLSQPDPLGLPVFRSFLRSVPSIPKRALAQTWAHTLWLLRSFVDQQLCCFFLWPSHFLWSSATRTGEKKGFRYWLVFLWWCC